MNDTISSISVILVFLLVLLNFVSLEITKCLNKEKPGAAEKIAREKYLKALRILLLKSLCINLVFIIVAYILLPDTIFIIINSTLSLWNFDTLSTLYVFIELGLLSFAIFSFVRTGQILNRLFE